MNQKVQVSSSDYLVSGIINTLANWGKNIDDFNIKLMAQFLPNKDVRFFKSNFINFWPKL